MKRPHSDAASSVDRHAHAAWARLCNSISPESTLLAWTDWATHLATSPGKRVDLSRLAFKQYCELARYLRECIIAGPGEARALVIPPARDRRFADPEWRQWPFNLWHQSFLLNQRWWEEATQGVWGVNQHHEDVVAFGARQWLDMFSPGNMLATNPVVLRRTVSEGGMNLARGFSYLIDDIERQIAHLPPAGTEKFIVGRDVGVTPGKVVLRNRLMELIQYTPATAKVHPEPILIVPAWIMKYYILDLSPHNSLIRYLVEQGHTVFCISWKNPDALDRDLGMEDYLELGWRAGLDAVNAIVPGRKVHAAGYCLGGTLLSIGAAAMARDGDDRLVSLTLLAAQTDFSEPGELSLFIDESQISLLEAQMAQTGYLTSRQMAGAFQMLRSYDLLWSRLVNHYLLGTRRPPNDLMAWNADGTRLPAKMHSQYLRRLLLDNQLAQGRYRVRGAPLALSDLALPIFVVGTVADHVAPWRSVFKLHALSPAEITFVLASGGHNAGIVSEPGRPRSSHQIQVRQAESEQVSPDEWLETAPAHDGSWWPQWQEWLKARSGTAVKPPRTGAPPKGYKVAGDAPGSYVMQRS